MAEQEVKLKITTDASGAVTGINSFSANLKKLSTDSESISAKLKKNWVETSAAIYAAWALIGKAAQYMDQGAAALRIESSFKIIAEESGASASQMIDNLKKLTKETIDDSDLMQKANKLMLAGYNPKQIQQFASVAGTAAQYMGTTTSEAFERISDALASRMPRAMVQAGAATTTQMKLVQAAIKAGVEDTVLFDLAIANLRVKQLQLQGTQDEATVAMQRFHAQIKQTGEDIGKILIRACQILYAQFQGIGAISLTLSSAFWKLAQGFAAFRGMITFGDTSKEFKAAADRYKAYAEADFAAAKKLFGAATDNITGTANVGKRASKEQIDNEKKVRDAILDKMKAYVEVSKNADRALKIEMEANKKAYEAEVNDAQHAAKMKELSGEHQLAARLDQINAEQIALNKLYAKNTDLIGKSKVGVTIKNAQYDKAWEEYSKDWDKNENKRAETSKEITNFIRDTNISMFKQIDQYSGEYQKAEEDATRRKYDTLRSIVDAAERLGIIKAKEASNERILIAAAEANEIATIAANIALSKARAMQDVTATTKGPYSAEYQKVTEDAIRSQAQVLKLQLGDRFDAEEWITAKIQEENVKRLESQADYYSKIGGYEKKALSVRLKAIEERRIAEGRSTGDQAAANQKALEATNAAIADEYTRRISLIQGTMAGYADLFEGLSQMYDKDSSERKRLHDVAMAFMLAEKIAAFASAVVKAVEACANAAANGDPYTAVARVAAVAAALGAVFASAGMSMHLGGGGSDVAPAKPQSTVFGAAAGTSSESIDKSTKLLEDIYSIEYRELRGIHDSMKELNANITGLVRSIVSTGTISMSGAGMFDLSTTYGDLQNLYMKSHDLVTKVLNFGPETIHKLIPGGFGNLLGKAYDFTGKIVGGLINGLFGGKTSAEITGGGLYLGTPSVGGTVAGQNVSAQWYSTAHYKKDGGWFGKDKEWNETRYSAVDESVTRLLTQVYKGMSDTLVELTKGLGTDMAKTLAYTFPAASLELKGKTGEEITKALKEFFSQVGDTAVNALFGAMLTPYQKVGEGMMETAVRILIDKEVILETLKKTGQAFTGTIPQIIAFSESLIEMAGGLDKLTEAASYYYDNFFTEAEKFVNTRDDMMAAFADLDMTMPRNRQAYRDLVEGLDLTTEAGQQAYVTLMQMAEASDKYYDALDEMVGKIKDARESMQMEGMAYQQMKATQGQLALQTVLEQARQGNFANVNATDFSSIASAASSTALFATRQEYQANYYRTYNRLAELEGIIGGTIPIDQQQLDVQKEILAIMKGDNRKWAFSSGDVATATAAATAAAMTTAASSANAGVLTAPMPGEPGYDPNKAYLNSMVGAIFKTPEEMANPLAGMTPEEQFQYIITHSNFVGWHPASNTSQPLDPSTIKMAEGGSFPGGWRLVGENGPELERTGPSRIYSNKDSKALLNMSEVVTAINGLREDLNAIGYAVAKNTGKSAKIQDRWDVDGIPAERTLT